MFIYEVGLTNWCFIGLRVHLRSTCCKWGRVIPKLVNANPGLKVSRSIDISCELKVFTGFASCILRLFKLKTEGKII